MKKFVSNIIKAFFGLVISCFVAFVVAAIIMLGMSSCSDPVNDIIIGDVIEAENKDSGIEYEYMDITLIDYDGVGYIFQVNNTKDVVFMNRTAFVSIFGKNMSRYEIRKSIDRDYIEKEYNYIPGKYEFSSIYITLYNVLIDISESEQLLSDYDNRWLSMVNYNFDNVEFGLSIIVGENKQEKYIKNGVGDSWNVIYYSIWEKYIGFDIKVEDWFSINQGVGL